MQISVYGSQNYGVFSTLSDAILWAIYTDMHGSATRDADLESGKLKPNLS